MLVYRRLMTSELERIRKLDRSDSSPVLYESHGGILVKRKLRIVHKGFSELEWDEHIRKFTLEMESGNRILFGGLVGDDLAGLAGLETGRRYGRDGNMINMGPLWVSKPWRFRGVGRKLFEMTVDEARKMGASALYISSTPVQKAVGFYLGAGCRLLDTPDEELFAREPEDIHMIYPLIPALKDGEG
jgi:GNAT superfamily N-acetyltransferase